ncbi:MAG: hypothetical protein M5R40_14520 [Anaerolineae bacterium]|nr:hypothetical protein [Anaerolineae bacterium]
MPAGARRLPGLNPVSFETLTLDDSTAQGLNSTSRTGSVILFSVEGGGVHMRDDGTDPTNSTGVVFGVGSAPYFYSGDLGAVRFCRQGASGTSTVHLIAYRQPGD